MGNKRWTAREIGILKTQYGWIPLRGMARLLPGRSEDAIFQRARKLGLVKDVPEARAEAPKSGRKERTRADDYGPYDPSSRCRECAYYGYSLSQAHRCTCWHVKGEDGNYKTTRPDAPSCRYFRPGSIDTFGG